MSLLQFQGVSLAYEPARKAGSAVSTYVLDGIDLTIRQGEFVTVLGRSGAGKTSLLNLAAGFIMPTNGQVLFDGIPVRSPGAERAVVFQDDALLPWLTVAGNVALPLRLRHASRADRDSRTETLLEQVGLAGFGKRHVWELSGGQRQRVGIARALAGAPPFLLMDEPLGALDAMTRERMQDLLLRTWGASGAGTLLITHSIDEAVFLGTRILVLAPGPGRIVRDVESPFSARFLAGEPGRELRSRPDFIALREDLAAAIHADEMEPA